MYQNNYRTFSLFYPDNLCFIYMIIHETTHYEIGMKVIKKKARWHVDYNDTMNRNIMKNDVRVAELYKKLLKEIFRKKRK